MDEALTNAVFTEQKFWLQIMGDHARFIFYSLAPNETGEIPRAQAFILNYDNLLGRVRNGMAAQAEELGGTALKYAYDFRAFQLQLLSLTLGSRIKISLSAALLSHMVNETDEYISLMNLQAGGQNPVFNPVHYHLLWLYDAVGHSAAVSGGLDETEKSMISSAVDFEKTFTDLYMKAVGFAGYMRTKLKNFPALEALNKQSETTMLSFKEFLERLKVFRKDGTVPGGLSPLMADHMAREGCYYLLKLFRAADNVSRPNCDPARPRFEN